MKQSDFNRTEIFLSIPRHRGMAGISAPWGFIRGQDGFRASCQPPIVPTLAAFTWTKSEIIQCPKWKRHCKGLFVGPNFMLEIDRATKRRCSRRPALVDGACWLATAAGAGPLYYHIEDSMLTYGPGGFLDPDVWVICDMYGRVSEDIITVAWLLPVVYFSN